MQTSATDLATEGSRQARLLERYVAWTLDFACLLPLLLLLASSRMQYAMANARAAMASIQEALPALIAGALANPQPTMEMAQGWLADPAFADAAGRLQSALASLLVTPIILYALLALVWTVAFESSRWQATPGKRALALVVASTAGEKLTNGHVLQRYLASSLSWLSLNLGHAMAALPPKHLALHDRISGTRVLRVRRDASLPAWAWTWLLLQVAATLAAFLWLFMRVQTAMGAALQLMTNQL